MRTFCGGFVLLAVLCSFGQPCWAEETTAIGKKISDFELQDYQGAKYSLSQWADQKGVAVVFLGTQCPVAKLYGPRLSELAREFKDRGIAFVGINSNRQDTLAEIAHYARVHGIDFPLLKDPGNEVADRFGAQRTPEAFLLDREGIVRYHGRIDDQYGVGFALKEAGERYLASAIEEMLADKPFTLAENKSVGCYIGRVQKVEPTGDVTYGKQISRIFQKRCVECHRAGEVAPFAMTSYEEVAPWAETIREVISDQRMPPWHASPEHGKFWNDARMPDEEKQLVSEWVKNGAPEGDPADLPAPREFTEGWRIGQPEVVYRMPEAYKVPATGTVEYQYFEIDPGFTEDKWLKAAEVRPGNRAVVHHLIMFYRAPGQVAFNAGDALFNSLAAYAPGMPASVFPEGISRRIPAGSKIIFQVHYTPNGSEQLDLSEAGLTFADPKTVKKELTVKMALNFRFRIPPGESNYPVEASYKFPTNELLYSMTPHMHLRGKSFRYEAVYPDGTKEVLLDVPRYDFNWQNMYLLETPKLMPRGTTLHCYAHFDNSENNLANPDPSATVTWGDQTWQEMMVGTFTVSPEDQDLSVSNADAAAVDDKQL